MKLMTFGDKLPKISLPIRVTLPNFVTQMESEYIEVLQIYSISSPTVLEISSKRSWSSGKREKAEKKQQPSHSIVNNGNRKTKLTHSSRRLGEVDKHRPVEWIISLRVVPHIVTQQPGGFLVNQNIPADTCVHSTFTHFQPCCCWLFLQAAVKLRFNGAKTVRRQSIHKYNYIGRTNKTYLPTIFCR